MPKRISVGKKILSSNEEYAARNRHFFAEHKILCLNMISSPGSGKTTILASTIDRLKDKLRIGVIEGDVQTDLDAKRIEETGAPVVQIETRGSCHLSAAQVAGALERLPADKLDVVFIENVGNLVCPSAFELGETAKAVVLSVAEGDDKPAKYPAIFAKSKVMLINKIDLLDSAGLSDFDIKRAQTDALKLNKDIDVFAVSARTGEGMDAWCRWLARWVESVRAS